jgi:hypothetical protein
MKPSKWFSIRLLDIDHQRFTSGKWRIEEDELETRLRVKGVKGEVSDWMTPGLTIDAYREIAEQMFVNLHRAA